MAQATLAFLGILSVWALPVLLAITLHEAAHGYAARRLGDETASRERRLSLNPFRHVDPVGTVLLPMVLLFSAAPYLFGWAKPIPVSGDALGQPRRDRILVAIAGPCANLLMAIGAALLFHVAPLLPEEAARWIGSNLRHMIEVNLAIAIINILPIPPLDAGRILVGLLPDAVARPLSGLERHGNMIIVVIVFLLPMVGGLVDADLDIAYRFIATPLNALTGLLSGLAGSG